MRLTTLETYNRRSELEEQVGGIVIDKMDFHCTGSDFDEAHHAILVNQRDKISRIKAEVDNLDMTVVETVRARGRVAYHLKDEQLPPNPSNIPLVIMSVLKAVLFLTVTAAVLGLVVLVTYLTIPGV